MVKLKDKKMDISERISEFIYMEHGTHWNLLSQESKERYIKHYFLDNIGTFKLSSGITVKELFDREEESFAKREALRKI